MAELDRLLIASRIKQARERAGLSQPELADLLNTHFRTVQTWESQKDRRVPFGRLDEIARATGVTKEWLLHGDEPATSPREAEVIALLQSLASRLDRIEEQLDELQAERRAVREPGRVARSSRGR